MEGRIHFESLRMRCCTLLTATLISCCAVSGCKTTDKADPILPPTAPRQRQAAKTVAKPSEKKSFPFAPKKKEEEKNPVPQQMAAIWKDAVYTQPGKPPTRGFGGRIYFYNSKSEPIQVNGQLTVFAFDDSKESQGKAVPSKKYVFTEDLFEKHHSETELGHSYSIWIPWDAAGGATQSVSLVPVFKSSAGMIVRGDHTRNVLPGVTPQPETQIAEQPSPNTQTPPVGSEVRPVGYERAYSNLQQSNVYGNGRQPRMTTHTISLPHSLSRQLQQPQVRGGVGGRWDNPPLIQYGRRQLSYEPSTSRSATSTSANATARAPQPVTPPRPTAVFGAPGQIPGRTHSVAERNWPVRENGPRPYVQEQQTAGGLPSVTYSR